MKNIFNGLGIFTKFYINYCLRQQYTFRTSCSNQTYISYSCYTNLANRNKFLYVKGATKAFVRFFFSKLSKELWHIGMVVNEKHVIQLRRILFLTHMHQKVKLNVAHYWQILSLYNEYTIRKQESHS